MAWFSRVIVPFLLLAYIATETYMKLQHSSLCEATGCKLAGELLKFDSIYLNYFGMAGVFVLLLVGFVSLKSNLAKRLFSTVLYGAIAFEATIIIYQFIANPEPCVFCMGIFASLLLIALLSNIKQFLVVVVIVSAIAMALYTLAISQNKSFVIANGTYLIHSDSCPHCKKVKKYLAQNHIKYTPISAKEVNARAFLKFVSINSIPVLLLKDTTGIRIIQGDKAILAYYQKPQQTNTTTASSSTLPSNPTTMGSFLSAGAKDDGCALSITASEPCETETKPSEPTP